MTSTQPLTASQFIDLYNKARLRYDREFEMDRAHDKKLIQSEAHGVSGYDREEHYPMYRYMFNDKKVRDAFIERFCKGQPKIEELRTKEDLSFQEYKEIRKKLPKKYLDQTKRDASKFLKEERGDERIDIKPMLKLLLEVYANSGELSVDYHCHYFSTKAIKNKVFFLTIDFINESAEVKGFHDKSDDIYKSKEKIKYREGITYINLFKNGNHEDDQLHLVLFKEGRAKLQDLNIISGSFTGVSYDSGEPIASELILIKQTKGTELQKFNLKAKKHLSIERKRLKVRPVFMGDGNDYNQVFNRNFSEMDNLVGTHLVGRYYQIRKRKYLVLSVLRVTEDYTITLKHPHIDRELRCLPRTSNINGYVNTLIVDVLYHKPGETVNEFTQTLIAMMLEIPNRKNDLLKGSYCGITETRLVNGSIVLYHLSPNPDFGENKELEKKKLLIGSIKDNTVHEKINKALDEMYNK